jgi:AICAR transformylase/IMP cyclohydrolase PurH
VFCSSSLQCQSTHQLKKYDIPEIDLIIVDLYPFEETVEYGRRGTIIE